jgi:hypothetical protein
MIYQPTTPITLSQQRQELYERRQSAEIERQNRNDKRTLRQQNEENMQRLQNQRQVEVQEEEENQERLRIDNQRRQDEEREQLLVSQASS